MYILRDNDLCGALEYDLARMGISLGDLFTGRLTYRKVIVYIRHLPPESALALVGWAGSRKLNLGLKLRIAQVNEARVMNYNLVRANSKDDIEPPNLIDIDEWEADT